MEKNGIGSHFPHTAQRLAHQTPLTPRSLESKLDQAAERREQMLAAKTPPRPCRRIPFGDPVQVDVARRLQVATERRTSTMQQRLNRLAEKAHLREEKLALARAHRHELLDEFRRDATEWFDELVVKSGLSLEAYPEAVEDILTFDPVPVCDGCGGGAPGPCPAVRGKVHKRHLVAVAEKFLHAASHITTLSVKAKVTEDTTIRKDKRNLASIVPQQLLIAFHINAIPSEETGESAKVLAREMLTCFYAIRDCLKAPPSDRAANTDEDLLSCLRDFSVAWRFYVRGLRSMLHEDKSAVRHELTQHLIRTYLDMLKAHRQSVSRRGVARNDIVDARRKELDDTAAHQLSLIKCRIQHVGGHAAVSELESRIVASMTETTDGSAAENPTTCDETDAKDDASPPAKPAKPTELPPPLPSAQRLGPELPPRWYVDDRGVSRSPHNRIASESPYRTSDDEAVERARRLEFRARKAHEARVRISCSKNSAEAGVVQELKTKVSEAALSSLAAKVPDDSAATSYLLQAVAGEIIECYPPRVRDRVSSSVREAFDLQLHNLLPTANVSTALCGVLDAGVHHVKELCAPARVPEIEAKTLDVKTLLAQEDIVTSSKVKSVFGSLFLFLQQLRRDLADYNLMTIQHELRQRAVEFEREYFALQIAHPTQNTLDWVAFCRAAGAQSSADLSDVFAMKQCVADGIVSSLSTSDGRATPVAMGTEVLKLDWENMFNCANAVQMCTVRLLVSGVVALLCAKNRSAMTSAEAQELDRDVVAILEDDSSASGPERLESIKERARGAINTAVHRRCGGIMPIDDDHLLSGSIDRATDTTRREYTTCETRVLNVLRVAKSTDVDAAIATNRCSAISGTLRNLHQDVHTISDFHWAVFGPMYTTIFRNH
eukprot:PhM_4_TR3485/c0_g1_i1/m.14749